MYSGEWNLVRSSFSAFRILNICTVSGKDPQAPDLFQAVTKIQYHMMHLAKKSKVGTESPEFQACGGAGNARITSRSLRMP